MESAFFENLGETAAASGFAGRYVGTTATAGPWTSAAMHAGPPSALLAHALMHLPGLPAGAVLTRFTVEILAPVPVGEVFVTARVARPGRRVALASAGLVPLGGEDPVLLATAVLGDADGAVGRSAQSLFLAPRYK